MDYKVLLARIKQITPVSGDGVVIRKWKTNSKTFKFIGQDNGMYMVKYE